MEKPATDYLSHIKFDPKLRSTLHAKYLSNIRLVILIILSILALGIFAYFTIPKRLNPEIKIPIVTVHTTLPGAGPADVESLVTIPLEDSLKNVEGIDTITSNSGEGSSNIIINFLSTVNGDKALTDVQNQVNTVQLTEDAKSPTVKSLDFEDQPFWVFTLSTDRDLASLMRFAKTLRENIEDLKVVNRVITAGYDEQTIQIVIRPEKIKSYGLNVLQILQAVQKATKSYPAGSVTASGTTLALTINSDVATLEDIRNLTIPIQQSSLKLADIADISERSKLNTFNVYFADKKKLPQRAVEFFIYKAKNANIDEADKKTRELVEGELQKYPGAFALSTNLNNAEEIEVQFTDLYSEFLSTVILVFVLLFIFLGLRQAIISSVTVPLTFLSAFAIINALGLTLNFLTMFAFLIALGLLIDDTIVTVAAMTRYYKTGKFTPYETGLMVWRDFIIPLWSTTITTIWAFVPLLLSTGIIGQFIRSIPIVVTVTMLSSTTIAVLITLPLMIFFLKPNIPRRVKILLNILLLLILYIPFILFFSKNQLFIVLIILFTLFISLTFYLRKTLTERLFSAVERNKFMKKFSQKASHVVDHGLIDIEPLSERYHKLIDRILVSRSARNKTLIAIVVFAVLAYMLIPLGFVVNEFFPGSNEDLVYLNVELPAGTKTATVNQKAQILLSDVRFVKEVDYVTAETGSFYSGGGGGGSGSDANQNAFLITLHLTPKAKRQHTSSELATVVRNKYEGYSDGKLTVQELAGGPPAGSDIQIKLAGDDLTQLDGYANKVVTFLKSQKGVLNVDKSIKAGTSKVIFTPDKEKLAELNISVDTIGLWLRTYASGLTLDTIKFDSKDKDIVLLTKTSEVPSPDDLAQIEIPTQNGTSYPLLSLGKLRLEPNPTQITREDRKRTISVSASVAKGFVIASKNKDLETFAKNSLGLPQGYSWSTGGVNEENNKSVQSILQAMVLSFLLILITMVLEFGSFRQALIAMLLIPLSIAGVFYIFALTGTPLSFPALIGILSLFGIVVTHAIVVIEKINENRKEGIPLRHAITDAASKRLEPVLLTSAATIVGLAPITVSNPLWRGLGGAIISGLLFSGAIKLFFVPIVYYNWFRSDEERKVK